MKKKILSFVLSMFMAVAILHLADLHVKAEGGEAWDGTMPSADAGYAFSGGDGSEDTPYLISTAADLAQLSANVNDGTYYSGGYFKMTTDIDLNYGIEFIFNPDTGLVKVTNAADTYWLGTGAAGNGSGDNETFDSNASRAGGVYTDETSRTMGTAPFEPNAWTPIGSDSNHFAGNFDGSGYKVRGIYINSSLYQGLFGKNNGGTIKNVEVVNSYICGHAYLGSVVGYNYGGTLYNCKISGSVCVGGSGMNTGGVVGYTYDGMVENCENSGNVIGHQHVGGVAGYSRKDSVVKNCSNTGSVIGDCYIGGVVGYSYENSKLDNCDNSGNVIGCEYDFGGVVGCSDGTVSDCSNSGSIIGNTRNSDYAGGVVGRNNSSSGTVYNCNNTGTVICSSGYAGGVVSYNYGGTITNCENRSVVNGKSIGGVAAYSTGTVSNCHNFANITGSGERIGGVVGHTGGGTVSSCSNNGNVTGSYDSVGGVVGQNGRTVSDCHNTGSVSGRGNVGGVIGYNYYKNSVVENCDNIGSVTGSDDNVGGVVGYNYNKATLLSSYNTGDVTGSTDNVGGVAGYNYSNSKVSGCHNAGSVNGSSNVGGVVGRSYFDDAEVSNSYNTGDVTGNSDYVGGVTGYNYSSIINKCYNIGSVSGGGYVGGVGGCNSNGGLAYCYNTGSVTGTSDYVGGVGGCNSNGSLAYCYNIGAVFGSSGYVGGVVGYGGSIGSCYYDKQMCSVGGINGRDESRRAEGELTSSMTSGSMGSGWGSAFYNFSSSTWVFTENLYPRLVDMDDTAAAYLSATPVFLDSRDNAPNVSKDFNLGTGSGVSWSSDNDSVISISDSNAAVIPQSSSQDVTLTAALNDISRTVKLTVSLPVTVSITTTSGAVTNTSPIPVEITFSESVTGFELRDITVTNGRASSFSGSGTTYSVSINPYGEGTVKIEVSEDVATNQTGKGNEEATPLNVKYDSTMPEVTIAAGGVEGTATNNSLIPLEITFSENVTDFESGYITVTNGTVTGFTGSGAAYSASITPSEEGTVTVSVAADVVTDEAGNGNKASAQLSAVYDMTSPTAPIVTSVNPVTNGTRPVWTWTSGGGGNGIYRYKMNNSDLTSGAAEIMWGFFMPESELSDGSYTLYVQERDDAGNWSLCGSCEVTVDTIAPSVAIMTSTGGAANSSPIPVTITFSESVTGFESEDITVKNGSIAEFSGSGEVYSASIIPINTGLVMVDIDVAVAEDQAGNKNTEAAHLNINYNTVPTVTTKNITSYTSTTAVMGGEVTTDGGETVGERGVVYSTGDTTPTIGETGVVQDENGSGMGDFSEMISGLLPDKIYYVRAYATNSVGVSYGEVVSFTTEQITASITSAYSLTEGNLDSSRLTAVITGTTFSDSTLDVSNFTLENVPAGVSIESVTYVSDMRCTVALAYDGTDFDSDISDFNLKIGSSELEYESDLTTGTLKIKAEIEMVPTVKTTSVTACTEATADMGGEVTADGGETVGERGVAYSSDDTTPTIGETGVIQDANGYGVGSFSEMIRGLIPDTTYYVRAYATNSVGTSYGNLVSFKTEPISASIIPASSLTEETLDGNSLTVTLTGTAFSDSEFSASNFTLNNAPTGVTVTSVVYGSDTVCTVALAYDGTDFDSDVSDFSLTIGGTELTSGSELTTGALTITATANNALPSVITSSITEIDIYSAKMGGKVTGDGDEPVTVRGVVYSIDDDTITIEEGAIQASNGSGIGSFSETISGLLPHTTYYVCAYATNSVGTSYGDVVSFTTEAITASIAPAFLLTEESLDNNSLNVSLSGTTFIDSSLDTYNFKLNNAPEGVTVTDVVYGNSKNCTVNIAYDGTDFDEDETEFSLTINAHELTSGSDLVTGTLTITATVSNMVPTVSTSSITGIDTYSAIMGGEVTADGDEPVSGRGVLYSSGDDSPTIEEGATKVSNGSGTGSFSETISGLASNTIYYVCAYAVNSVGISYGDVVTFKTGLSAPATGKGYMIDYSAETITIESGYEVSTDSRFDMKLTSGDSITPGMTFYVRKADDSQVSTSVSFTLSQRPAAPEIVSVNETIDNKNDGSITNVTTSMEYKMSSDMDWTTVSAYQESSGIIGLAEGIYQIRYKAVTDNGSEVFAGQERTITIYAGRSITVAFDSMGGSPVGGITDKAYGDLITAPAAPTKNSYYFSGWYKDSSYSEIWSFTIDTLTSDITLYAKWDAVPTYTVIGYAVDDTEPTGNPISGATVRLIKGAKQYGATAVTDENGNFEINNIPAGTYNLVIIKGEKKVIIIVKVISENLAVGNVAMPSKIANSSLVVAGNETPDVVVGGLNKEANSQLGTSSSVEITLNVEKKDSSEAANGSEVFDSVEISGKAVGMILDIDVVKIVDGSVDNDYNETANLIEIIIPLPTELQGKQSYSIHRYHNGSVDTVTTNANDDGEYIEISSDKKQIVLYSKRFSTYAIAYTDYSGSSGTSSSRRYKITAKAGEGGRIIPTNAKVKRGNNKTFNITAYEGYIVSNVLVDGKSMGAISRYTFKKIKSSHEISAIFAKDTGNSEETWNNPYIDVRENNWYYSGVKYISEKGLMNGTGSNIFKPMLTTTRGMIVTIIYRMEGEPETTGLYTFKDVVSGMYYSDAVAWGAENSIIKGYSKDSYGPDDNITREQLAAILYRYALYKGHDITSSYNLAAYSDVGSISDWAIENVRWAVAKSLMCGTSVYELSPGNECTRAQTAVMLMRFIEEFE